MRYMIKKCGLVQMRNFTRRWDPFFDFSDSYLAIISSPVFSRQEQAIARVFRLYSYVYRVESGLWHRLKTTKRRPKPSLNILFLKKKIYFLQKGSLKKPSQYIIYMKIYFLIYIYIYILFFSTGDVQTINTPD